MYEFELKPSIDYFLFLDLRVSYDDEQLRVETYKKSKYNSICAIMTHAIIVTHWTFIATKITFITLHQILNDMLIVL